MPTRPSLAAALLCALAAPAPAQEVQPIAAMRLSAELFQAAQALSDPLLMIASAKLRKSVALDRVERAPEEGDAADVPDPGALDWQAMLAEAEALAAGDPTLAGLVDDVRVETTKGVASGQVYSRTTIRGGGRNTYAGLVFDGGTYADVYVEAGAGADLNLFVTDAQGRLVCSDTDLSAIAYCGWRPEARAAFTIEVRNASNRGTPYDLMTN
ncbi:hypothetical protein DXV76_15555 [Rhodobacteraceae bacterium CCMM004]|nr:hypothetical protein DXV76_15555 [Rhodobacteraceae bacterium CCMM004]